MRYLPLTDLDRRQMLDVIGVGAVDDLFAATPRAARIERAIGPPGQSELQVRRHFLQLAAKNLGCDAAKAAFLGAGVYRHHIPAAVDHLIQRGEYLTTYTPYQPEIAQGTLQILFEFQTQIAMMTGMEIANASMYDGATAAAEAAAMACRISKRKKVLVSGSTHPHHAATITTFLRLSGITVDVLPPDPVGAEDLLSRVSDDLATVVVQMPGFFGHLQDVSALATAVHDAGGLLTVAACEPLAWGVVAPPGDMGADIVVADGQGLATPPTFGGPGLGLFATHKRYSRHMPGRLCGETVDADGKRGYVLTLSTREQHIRREKATSNICTNAGLVCAAFSMHMTLLGDAGYARLAEANHAIAVKTAERLEEIDGVDVLPERFFNEFAVRLSAPAAPLVEACAEKGVFAGVPVSRFHPDRPELDNVLLVAATELNDDDQIDLLAASLAEQLA